MSLPSVRHEAAIPPQAQRHGFAAALYEHTGIRLGNCRVVPDGFIFNAKRKRLYFFEVYVTHVLTADKLSKLRIIRDFMGDLGWTLRVSLACWDGRFRLLDWEYGRPSLSIRELRAAMHLLDGKCR